MKAVNFLNITLNLTTGKYQTYNKPDSNPLYINILSNHPPSIIKNLPGNISKRINNLSVDKATFNKSKDLYNNTYVESGFKHKITFQKEQNTSTVTHNTKNRKRMINVLMFQQISSELSHFTWDKKKVKINLDLDRSILDKAKKKKKNAFYDLQRNVSSISQQRIC